MESICPICNKPLQDGDELKATWFEPKRWFVLWHMRDGQSFCAQANHPLVWEMTETMRALSEQKAVVG